MCSSAPRTAHPLSAPETRQTQGAHPKELSAKVKGSNRLPYTTGTPKAPFLSALNPPPVRKAAKGGFPLS
jgi:hypothetical protein